MAGPYDLAGTGIQAVAQPAALIVTATHLGTRVTQGTANPPNYRNIGQLTPGDADGWYGAVPIRVSPQKIVLPAGVTQLGYGLLAGSTVHVVEVAPPPVLNSSLNPWDRGPSVWTETYVNSVSGGTGDLVLWSYTVPAAKVLRVGHAAVSCQRVGPASAVQGNGAYMMLNGTRMFWSIVWSNNVGQISYDQLAGGPVDLPAGAVLEAHAFNSDTGGSVYAVAQASGYLYNA